MTKKSVIEIDVQDDSFKQFYELFKQYSAKVEELPDDWKKVKQATDENGASASGFNDVTREAHESLLTAAVQAKVIGEELGRATQAQKSFHVAARGGSAELAIMAKHAKTLGSEVFGIGKFLMHLGKLGLGAVGIGSILSGFGLYEIGQSSLRRQGEARSIGVSQGQLTAFGQDYGRYVDASILGKVANAQTDLNQLPWLARATGLSLQKTQSASVDTLSMSLVQRAHDWWKNTPAGLRNAQGLQSSGLQQFFTMDQIRRLGNASQPELSLAASQYARDSGNLNVSNRSNDAWYSFTRQLENAGNIIKVDLTNRLSELAPELKIFIKTFTDDAKILIDEVLTPQNLHKLGDAITWLVSKVAPITKNIDSITGVSSAPLTANDKNDLNLIPGGGFQNNPLGHVIQSLYLKGTRTARDFIAKEKSSREGGVSGKEYYLDFLEGQNNLPPGLLDAIWSQESARGKYLKSPKGALGDFGFMPKTAAERGINTSDFYSGAKGAAGYETDLISHYRGNIRKAIAAYNWGQGNLDKDIASHGSMWAQHLPAETQNYLSRVTAALAKRQAIKLDVNVHNSTSARVAVSTHAATSTVGQ